MEPVSKILLLFSLFSAAVSSPQGVPAIVWSNEKSHEFPAALTGHSLDVQQFKEDYLPPSPSPPHSATHHMLLFMQDKLSMEDFSQHADVYNENSDGATFHNLKHLLEKNPSSHVASLSSPSSLLHTMSEMADTVHTVAAPYSLAGLQLHKQRGVHLIVIQLPATTGLHTREALSQIDGIIQSVHEQMEGVAAPFTAVYTAKASSKPVGPNVVVSSGHGGGRHLLQADQAAATTNASFWNLTDGCLYLYAQSIIFEVYKINADNKQPSDLKNYTLPAWDKAEDGSTCGNNSAKLVVDYGTLEAPKEDEVELKSFKFTMEFSSANGYWTLDNMTITYDATVGSTSLAASNDLIEAKLTRDIFAPVGYSYHCSYQNPFYTNQTAQEDYYARVRTVQLQTQLNGEAYSGEFGQVNDCIGFFTIPIWSALITMAVLISIFFFGVCMLASVDTQDRFDDPKGKTIQVNTSE